MFKQSLVQYILIKIREVLTVLKFELQTEYLEKDIKALPCGSASNITTPYIYLTIKQLLVGCVGC